MKMQIWRKQLSHRSRRELREMFGFVELGGVARVGLAVVDGGD